MGGMLRVVFNRDEDLSYARVATRSMRQARRQAGMTPRQWAETLESKVEYGTVSPGAIECYEEGGNVPGTDLFLAALATAGFPIHRLIELWLSPRTHEMVAVAVNNLWPG